MADQRSSRAASVGQAASSGRAISRKLSAPRLRRGSASGSSSSGNNLDDSNDAGDALTGLSAMKRVLDHESSELYRNSQQPPAKGSNDWALNEVLDELLKTEANYARDMHFTANKFAKPLRELLDAATAHKIFSNLATLMELHDTLASHLPEADGTDGTDAGDTRSPVNLLQAQSAELSSAMTASPTDRANERRRSLQSRASYNGLSVEAKGRQIAHAFILMQCAKPGHRILERLPYNCRIALVHPQCRRESRRINHCGGCETPLLLLLFALPTASFSRSLSRANHANSLSFSRLDFPSNTDACRPYFKSYATYCANYPYVSQALPLACAEPRVETFLKGAELTHSVTLTALLFRPVQRMCVYPLLWQQALKHAPQGHALHEQFEKAFVVTQQAVTQVLLHGRSKPQWLACSELACRAAHTCY